VASLTLSTRRSDRPTVFRSDIAGEDSTTGGRRQADIVTPLFRGALHKGLDTSS